MLGIDLGSHSIKVVETLFSRGKAQVLCAVCEGITFDNENATQEERIEAYAAALRNILSRNKIKTKNAAIAIPAGDADVRIIKFQDKGGAEDAGGRPNTGPADMPFGMKETETYTQLLEGAAKDGNPDTKILLVTGNRKAIIDRFEIVRAAGLNPVIADVDAFAVLNVYMLEAKPAGEELTVVLDIGANTTNIAIVEGGIIKVVRTLFLAGNNFTRTLQHELSVPQEAAEALKRKYGLSKRFKSEEAAAPGKRAAEPLLPDGKTEAEAGAEVYDLLSAQVKQISAEVVRTIAYFTEKILVPEIHISKVALIGDSADMPGLADYLSGELEAPISIFRALEKLNLSRLKDKSCASHPGFAAAAGLSLRTPGDRGRLLTRVNLLPDGMIKKDHPAVRITVYLLTIALLFSVYYKYGNLAEKTEAEVLNGNTGLVTSKIRLNKAKEALERLKAGRVSKITAEVKPVAPKWKHAYIKHLTISGIFTDSSGPSAFLSGPDKSFVVKSGKMYDENGEVVPGVSVSIEQKSIVLSEGAEKYEIPIPE